ncbi:HD family phosphohydrolase [Aliterella atlantica]|uniref:HD family phosphohydrolase n=1 Tax=Aliterella atlantica TaxID=1827278 RepID=UPI000697EAB0|nr:HDIG domain-containing metalloprotein [Aliterella atlantica]
MKKLRLFQFLMPQKDKRRQQLLRSNMESEQKKFNVPLLAFLHRAWVKVSCWQQRYHSQAIFIFAVIALTVVLGHRFYNQPRLAVGTIALQTITAPYSARVEDVETTRAERKAARSVSTPVLAIDESINRQVQAQLQQALDWGNEIRFSAGAFPFVETSMLSKSVQHYLRSSSETNWQLILATVNSTKKTAPSAEALVNSKLAAASLELQSYSWKTSPEKLSELIAKVTQARQQYAGAKSKITQEQVNRPNSFYKDDLLDLSDEEWAKTQILLRTTCDRILTQGISPGLQPHNLQAAVSLQLKAPNLPDSGFSIPTTAETWANQLLSRILQPNLIADVEQTKQQAEKAALAVEAVILEVYKGETIVKAGEEITHRDFVLLDHFDLSRREINWQGLLQIGAFVTGIVGIFAFIERQFGCNVRQRDRTLVLLLALSTVTIAMLGVTYTSLPAIGLLLGSFYSCPLGSIVVGLVAILLTGSLAISATPLLAGTAGGLLASLLAGRMRSREELALLGGVVALVEAIAFLLVGSVFSQYKHDWYVLAQQAGLFGLSGLAWSIVALGLSPYLEHVFDLVTPIRLAELANPNRPLLKRLATNAPGTFQHTLFVSTLAEAAAKELGCNVELVRAGTFYHDIGKLHDPLGFIENQMGGPNKHDEINDPWQSAEIIKKHVSEGLVMARKHRLPKAIQAFIPEHQGTIAIAYFYYQAQQLAADNQNEIAVKEADFRYEGPIPQSRETGIVMLADACEAALRSLKDATYEEALAMVNKILRSRWQDNQMVDSGLTRKEMSRIAEIFVQVWLQFHHKRIAYPKATNS